jgi:hypothetical protein
VRRAPFALLVFVVASAFAKSTAPEIFISPCECQGFHGEMMPLQRAKEQNTMPKLVIALAIAVVGARPVVASQETDVMAPVRQFVDGFNKSDIKMAQAACADQYPRFDS